MYAGYPLALMFISRIKKNRIMLRPIEPKVTVVICTYNEFSVIDRRIENILDQDYPRKKLEIIVVDSSTDSTADAIKRKWIKNVTLIEQDERQGKPCAINVALKKASGDIILLSDAPTLFDKDAIMKIVRNFADPMVGGATGKKQPVGGIKRVQNEEKLFRRFKNMLKNLEGAVDSTTFFSGEFAAFRRRLIKKVDEDAIADDVNIAMKLRQKGYKTIYDPLAKFIEMPPNNYRDLITQKVRRAIGGIRETIRFKHAILNPKFGLYGMLILPTRFLYTILNPFVFVSFLLALVYQFLFLLFNFYSVVLLLFVCLVVVVLRKSSPVKALTMFLITQFIQLQALTKYLLKDYSVKWKQIKSTRINKNSGYT
jgi:cellulose synthase/poly-beta-1,6-N-acetylglucosamine synthase-like glycosyltransferase